ncbi:MAG: ribonuclease Y [Planctomycetota bacterium]
MPGNWTFMEPALWLGAAAPTGAAGVGSGVQPLWVVIVAVLMVVFGFGLGYIINQLRTGQTIETARAQSKQLLEQASKEADNAAEKVRLDVEREALKRKETFDKEVEAVRQELRETERRLAKRSDSFERKEEALEQREARLEKTRETLESDRAAAESLRAKAAELVGQQTTRLQEISGLTAETATERLLERVGETNRHEVGKLTRKIVEEAEEHAKEKAREITLMAVQRYATEHTSESTVRTVAIPSDDMKGRIIGREGRNIRAIEKATGVDIIVDDTPGVIVVSCFDKVRQAIAVESLERLIADGRMHPTRIEEVVEKTRSDVNKTIQRVGKDTAVEVNLGGLHPKVTEAMGKLHYRTSYGQNVLRHSVEVAYLCQIIAEQLGLDGKLARRCGYLHDIGKAMDHEMEGGHPKIGMDFARQHGEKEEAVLNAIGGHHADIPSTTFYTPIVMAADAVSSARPGARRESLERYVQRLNELQDIAMDHQGVVEAHAIQAGREVRVMVDADSVSDDEAYLIAHEIAKRVSDEMTFPGEIRVTVLRETRAIEVAR